MGLPVLVSDKTGYSDWVENGVNGIVLQTPMTPARTATAFEALQALIENPRWTPDQLREHARQVDDDVILEHLMNRFISC